jgi:TonB family protein
MQDPAFLEELKERIEKNQEPVPALPKSLLKKRIPNDIKPSLLKSGILHGVVLTLSLGVWAYQRYWISDKERLQKIKEQQSLKTAIRVDLVDLPSLKVSELKDIDLTADVGDPTSAPPETAMVDRTQEAVKGPENKPEKKPDKKDATADKRLKELQERMRAEQKRKDLITGLKNKKTRPALGGNIVSEGYSLTGDIATDKEAFSGKVQAHVSRNFKVPSWMNSSSFRAQVLVKIAPDGRLMSSELLQSSQDAEFDQAALSAIEKSDPFPAPPDSLKRLFLEEGVICGFP